MECAACLGEGRERGDVGLEVVRDLEEEFEGELARGGVWVGRHVERRGGVAMRRPRWCDVGEADD